MDAPFLEELYKMTYAFENWESNENYDSFHEAETDYFRTIEDAKSKGMNYIGRGGDRDVYSGGSLFGDDKVIKIARESLVQNRNAVEIWKRIPEEAHEHIASLVDWSEDYTWIVQERASGKGDIEEVGNNLAEHGLYVHDLNGHNVGEVNGQSVLLDLGQLEASYF